MRLRVVEGERFLSVEISVRRNSLIVGRGNIFMGIEIVLDTRKCKSQSWFIGLVRMLLVLCLRPTSTWLLFLDSVKEAPVLYQCEQRS